MQPTRNQRQLAFAVASALFLLFLSACSSSSSTVAPGSAGGPTPAVTTGTTYVYAAIYANGGGIAGYKQGSTGTLTAVSGVPLVKQSGTGMPALASDNGFVYIANQAGIGASTELIQFSSVASSGALTEVGTFDAGTAVTGDVEMHQLLVNPALNTMYGVFQFTIVSYALSSSGAPSTIKVTAPSTDSVWGFDFMPSGPFAYAAIQNGNPKTGFQTPAIHLLNVGANGAIADSRPVLSLPGTLGVAGDLKIDPSGKFVVVSTGPSNNLLSVFAIQSDGTLNEVPGSAFSTETEAVRFLAFDAAGKFLYVLNSPFTQSQTASLEVFSFDSATGALLLSQVVNLPSDQQASWLKLDGDFVYVTEVDNTGTSATITVYNRSSSTGQVAQASSTIVPNAIGETDTLHF